MTSHDFAGGAEYALVGWQIHSYTFITVDDSGNQYASLCVEHGLDATPAGWAVLYCVSASGERVTLVTADVEYMRTVAAGVRAGIITDDAPQPLDLSKFDMRPGWPDNWRRGTDTSVML